MSAFPNSPLWGYFDYTALTCGSDGPPKRGFQSLSKLDGYFSPTDEEMDYGYDAKGRLVEAVFGQSHKPGNAGALGYRGGTGNIPPSTGPTRRSLTTPKGEP